MRWFCSRARISRALRADSTEADDVLEDDCGEGFRMTEISKKIYEWQKNNGKQPMPLDYMEAIERYEKALDEIYLHPSIHCETCEVNSKVARRALENII